MLNLITRGDLQRLIEEKLPESLTLDYKRSQALAKDSVSRDKLAKDVSAPCCTDRPLGVGSRAT